MSGSSAASASAGSSDKSGGFREMLRQKTFRQLGNQKQRATESLGSVADAVRETTQHLRDGGQTTVADYVGRAADEIDRWSNSLRDRELNELMSAIHGFARRQPGIFVGAAFGLGVLGARFLRSSGREADRRYRPADR